MGEKINPTRRNVLKTSSALLAGGTLLSIPASAQGQKIGTDDAGITEEYFELLHDYKFEEAKQLLVDNNINFEQTLSTRPDDDGSGTVSPDDYFEKNTAEVEFSWIEVTADEYFLNLIWHLNDMANDIDTAPPRDVAAVAFNTNAARYIDDSLDYSGELRTKDFSTNDWTRYNDVTEVQKEPPLDSEGGASVWYDDGVDKGQYSTEGDGFLSIRIKRIESTGVNVGGAFSHAWSPATNVLQHVASFGGSGNLSFQVDPLVDNWELPGQDERDDTIY